MSTTIKDALRPLEERMAAADRDRAEWQLLALKFSDFASHSYGCASLLHAKNRCTCGLSKLRNHPLLK